ncbi:MAG TPA: GAD-like domain-containing protein [Rhizobium sp.]|nr:GAD-like domain-containing protein [Rhizobium sp.]
MKDYQVRLASIIEDFGAPKGGEAVDVERYRGKVPNAVIEFWEQNGTGIIMNGYFQFCDPARYASIMKFIFDGDHEIRPEQTHVLGFGAFGTIVAWNEVHQNMSVNLVNGQVSCQALISGKTYDPDIAVTSELMLLDDPTFDEYDADVKKLFKPARSKLGTLGVGQIYGFSPILALGGNRALASLEIYEALPHMAILAQAHDMQLMDNAPFPPRPVRLIGS